MTTQNNDLYLEADRAAQEVFNFVDANAISKAYNQYNNTIEKSCAGGFLLLFSLFYWGTIAICNEQFKLLGIIGGLFSSLFFSLLTMATLSKLDEICNGFFGKLYLKLPFVSSIKKKRDILFTRLSQIFSDKDKLFPVLHIFELLEQGPNIRTFEHFKDNLSTHNIEKTAEHFVSLFESYIRHNEKLDQLKKDEEEKIKLDEIRKQEEIKKQQEELEYNSYKQLMINKYSINVENDNLKEIEINHCVAVDYKKII